MLIWACSITPHQRCGQMNFASSLFCAHIASEQDWKLSWFHRYSCYSYDLAGTDTRFRCLSSVLWVLLSYSENKLMSVLQLAKVYPRIHVSVLPCNIWRTCSCSAFQRMVISDTSRDDISGPVPIPVCLIYKNRPSSCCPTRPSLFDEFSSPDWQCPQVLALGSAAGVAVGCSLHSQFSAPYTDSFFSLLEFECVLLHFKTPPKVSALLNMKVRTCSDFYRKVLGMEKNKMLAAF